jgi:hypothetical protein
MDYQTRKTGQIITCAIEDLKTVQNKLAVINKETCTDKTLHIIDEANDSIDMAIKFLEHIDMNNYSDNHVSENIKLGFINKVKK